MLEKQELFLRIGRQSSIIKWLRNKDTQMHNMSLEKFIYLNGATEVIGTLIKDCFGYYALHCTQVKNQQKLVQKRRII